MSDLIGSLLFGLFLGGIFLAGYFVGNYVFKWELKQTLRLVKEECPLKEKYGIYNDGIPTISAKKLKFNCDE